MNYETQVLALIREGNPIQDPDTLTVDQSDSAVYLATLTTRSSDVTNLDTNQTEPTSAKKSRMPWLIAAGVAAVIGVGAVIVSQSADDAPAVEQPTPTAGPVTIKTALDRSESPIQGTFEVTVGADVLGCSSGTLVSMNSETFGKKDNVMTCESGPNTGTFTIIYDPADTSRWNVLESSDDFAGLQGEGRISFVLPDANTVVETFTGDIEYTS